MAMALGPRGGGRNRRFRTMSDINVTPMVDVMLVLLIIFMVTAPLLTSGVRVDLPKTSAAAIKGDDEPISISIDAQGGIWLQNTAITLDDLVPKLRAITAQKPDTRIFIRGDKVIAYGKVMQIMGALSQAGFTKVALVTQSEHGPRPARDERKGR
jgi:biopolymer transport protein TolR